MLGAHRLQASSEDPQMLLHTVQDHISCYNLGPTSPGHLGQGIGFCKKRVFVPIHALTFSPLA